MKALLLDGFADDSTSRRVIGTIVDELKATGWQVDAIALRQKNIAWCTGCFGCWLRTPGECLVRDDGPSVTRAMIGSDLLVLACPVMFGGYSSELKKALDRFSGLVLPFFTTLAGEVHHSPRYERYPSLTAIGLMRAPDEESAEMFAALVGRNAVNFRSPAHAAGVVLEGDTDEQLRAKIRPLLAGGGRR